MRRLLPILFIAVIAFASGESHAQSPGNGSLNDLTGATDLSKLVELSILKLQLNLEYDAQILRGAQVTLRFQRPISDAELWLLTNTLLASRGFAVVQIPGSDFLTIVKAQTAPTVAGIEGPQLEAGREGFVRVLTEVQFRPVRDIIAALTPMLSKPGGTISQVGSTDLLLIADFKPRLDQVLGMLERLDVPAEDAAIVTIPIENLAGNTLSGLLNAAVNAYGSITGLPLEGKTILLPQGNGLLLVAPPDEVDHWRELVQQLDARGDDAVIETIPVTYLGASRLASMVESASTAYGNVTGAQFTGSLIPSPDDHAVVLIAPADELTHWTQFIERFDARQPVRTQLYAPRYFGVSEVSALIEDTVRDEGPRGAGDQWRVVTDELTGTLIITATENEHTQVTALLERLDTATFTARQPMRTYPIRNRPVLELMDILVSLVDAGALEATPEATTEATRPPRQQSRRDVLPPPANDGASNANRPSRPTTEPPISAAGRSARLGDEEFPLSLTADEGTNTLIALGDPRRLDQLEGLIETLDVRQPQVMIEVLLVSMTDGNTFDLGVELERLYVGGATRFNLASVFGLGTPGLANDGDSNRGLGGTALIIDPGDFRVLIRALETTNDGKAFNIPKVLVNNNQQAILDSVLQQPFTSTNASNTVSTTSFGGTQDAGTSVTVTPQIAEGDHLVLQYNVSLSTFVGESSDATIPPPRQQNTLESVVTIPDGYTVVLGGLETRTDAEAVSKVPLLSSLPLVGEAFKNRSRSDSRSRFWVFIRANVLRNRSFEDLKYMSDYAASDAGVANDWPIIKPRVIR